MKKITTLAIAAICLTGNAHADCLNDFISKMESTPGVRNTSPSEQIAVIQSPMKLVEVKNWDENGGTLEFKAQRSIEDRGIVTCVAGETCFKGDITGIRSEYRFLVNLDSSCNVTKSTHQQYGETVEYHQ